MSTRRKITRGRPGPAKVQGTGLRIEAGHLAHADLPTVVQGQHVWVMVGMWRLADPAAEQHFLDTENLLTLEGPGCWACEQAYTPAIARTLCPGMAEHQETSP